MVLEASVLGLHAPMEYGLIPGPSQGSSDYTHLAVCWISGPGASWCREWTQVSQELAVSQAGGQEDGRQDLGTCFPGYALLLPVQLEL